MAARIEKKSTHSIGHAFVYCIAFSASHLFVPNASYAICMFNLESNELDHEFVGHLQHVTCMRLSGCILASASHHDTIRVWNTDTRTAMHVMNDYSFNITCLDLKGAILCAGSYDSYACAWNAMDGKLLDLQKDHMASVTCTSISPSGHFWVTGSDDCSIVIKYLRYQDKNRKNLQLIAGSSSMTCLDTTDQFIVGGMFDGLVYMWDAYTGNILQKFSVHKGVVHKVAFMDNKILSRSAQRFYIHDAFNRTILACMDHAASLDSASPAVGREEEHMIMDFTYTSTKGQGDTIFVAETVWDKMIRNTPTEPSNCLVRFTIPDGDKSVTFHNRIRIPHAMERIHASPDGKYLVACLAPEVTVYRLLPPSESHATNEGGVVSIS